MHIGSQSGVTVGPTRVQRVEKLSMEPSIGGLWWVGVRPNTLSGLSVFDTPALTLNQGQKQQANLGLLICNDVITKNEDEQL